MEPSDIRPPWEHIHPALTAERILAIGTLIARGNNDKIAASDPRDWPWNIGCDCHAWVLDEFHGAAETEYRDWLVMKVKRGILDLDFEIGGVPAKFYQPASSGQPERTLRQANEDLVEFQESFEFEPEIGIKPEAPDPAVRFAVIKDDHVRVVAVYIEQLSLEGNVLYRWPVWIADPTVTAIDNAPHPEGVELGEPFVGLPEDEKAAEEKRKDNDKQEGA